MTVIHDVLHVSLQDLLHGSVQNVLHVIAHDVFHDNVQYVLYVQDVLYTPVYYRM